VLPIATAALTDDDNANAEVSSPVSVTNAGDTLNYTLTLTGLEASKDVSYTVTETSDDGSILTLPVTTTGTLTSASAYIQMAFTVASNADNEAAKSATFEITFTGADYQTIATKTVTVNLAAGNVVLPIATAALTDDDNANAEVSSPVSVTNAGDTLNYTLTLTGLEASKDVSYTVTETSDDGSILTLPVTTTGTLTSASAYIQMAFTVASNADNEAAKSATFEITFTGADYQTIATKTVTVNLAAGNVV
ncbi:MAG: hypothetical protein AB7C97_11355, partial [Oscillospiraceae bacterium]